MPVAIPVFIESTASDYQQLVAAIDPWLPKSTS